MGADGGAHHHADHEQGAQRRTRDVPVHVRTLGRVPGRSLTGRAALGMLKFLVRRAVMLVLTLFVSSFAIYSAIYVAPGNPIATLTGGRTPSPEAIAVLEERYHLNDPFFVRYFNWLGNAFTGDLGVSIPLRQDVSTLISQRVGTTIQLVLYAAVIIVIVGHRARHPRWAQARRHRRCRDRADHDRRSRSVVRRRHPAAVVVRGEARLVARTRRR